MSEHRTTDEWLVRYLIVGVVGATATLGSIYGLALSESLVAAAVSGIVLLLVSLVVGRDLRRFRTT